MIEMIFWVWWPPAWWQIGVMSYVVSISGQKKIPPTMGHGIFWTTTSLIFREKNFEAFNDNFSLNIQKNHLPFNYSEWKILCQFHFLLFYLDRSVTCWPDLISEGFYCSFDWKRGINNVDFKTFIKFFFDLMETWGILWSVSVWNDSSEYEIIGTDIDVYELDSHFGEHRKWEACFPMIIRKATFVGIRNEKLEQVQ